MAVIPVITPQAASAAPSTGNKTIAITPATGELLVVFAYTANGATTFVTPTGVTGSTFTLARSEQVGITGWSGVYCWTATVVTGGSYTLTGTATGANANNMICFRYPVGTTVGAVNGSHLATGNLPSVTLTTVGANSGIAVCVGDFNAVAATGAAFTTTAGTPAAALSQVLSGNVTGFESYYADVGAAGSKTVGMSAPSGQAPTTIALELLPPGAGAYSIFSQGVTGGVATFTGGPFCLGTEIGITTACKATTLWFYRNDTTITGAILGRLYSVTTATTGAAVSGTDVTFTVGGAGSGPTGWLSAAMAAPVALAVGRYRIVVLYPGSYSATNNYWSGTGAGINNVVSGPITAYSKANTTGNLQGSFIASAVMAYPTTLGTDSNYWADMTVALPGLPPQVILPTWSVTMAATY